MKLDVHQFAPEEVTVKTRENNLIIEAKHEEREDAQGFISRHFTRRYQLPDDVKVDQLVCNLSSDGILTIDAPRKSAQPGGETVIPIRQTGRPAAVTPTPTTPTRTSQPTSTTASAPTGQSQQGNKEPKNIPIEREEQGPKA